MKPPKPIEIDGRTGEGGGQLVRIAVALAAVASQPVHITNVRGNREGPRGGGLKSQHVTSIEWLVKATDAEVDGLFVGSKTLDFRPRLRPAKLAERKIKISAASAAASSLLIFQAILPFLLFASNENNDPIELEISGGTNVSWSLSYEYLDQVLLPSLDSWFGIKIDRQLNRRGWSMGPQSRGTITLIVHPLKPGATLKLRDPALNNLTSKDFDIKAIDISIITPADMHDALTRSLATDLAVLFPSAELTFVSLEESGHESRIYVLLVARSDTLRWGRDILFAEKRKGKTKAALSEGISRRVSKDLYSEVSRRGVVDEFLQDQLVVFQALAEGRTSFPRSEEQGEDEHLEEGMESLTLKEGLRKDKTEEPFGQGSTHTTTARWVTAELLPNVKWFTKGRVCEGIGMTPGEAS